MPEANHSPGPIAAELLFSTPLFSRLWPDSDDLHAYLRDLLLARERAEGQGTRQYSNVGGWHSPIDLQESWDRAIHLVLERCRTLAEEATRHLLGADELMPRYQLSVSAWANISRDGDYNVPHVHETAWSAVYYVDVPAACREVGSGGLELLDPRPATTMVNVPGKFFATRRLIVPEPGLLVVFPGSLMHFVHPFRGPGERISIACDVAIG